jgi:Holliday junction resolvasome RuvABC endonuclease subunit
MPLIAGIDPSAKKIAIVATHDVLQVVSAQSYPLYPKGVTRQTPESLGNAVAAVRAFLQWADQVAPGGTGRYAWIESPLVGRGGVSATMKQSFVGGIIRGMLYEAGFDVRDVNVTNWKREVTGNGRAEKPAVKVSVKQQWPKAFSLVERDGDLIDAAAIALYGRSVLGRADAIVAGPAEPA